jgi:hypothetical protein
VTLPLGLQVRDRQGKLSIHGTLKAQRFRLFRRSAAKLRRHSSIQRVADKADAWGSSPFPSPLAPIPPAALQTLDQKHADDHGENNFKDQPTNAHATFLSGLAARLERECQERVTFP